QGGQEGLTIAGLVVSLGYLIGVSLLVFHFANGLWTWAITWGLTLSKAAQKRWGYACAGLGACLMVLAWAGVIGFMTLDAGHAQRIERQALGGHVSTTEKDPTQKGVSPSASPLPETR